MKLPRIRIGRPQRLAALLLVFFLAECVWVVSHQQLSQQDYRYAECGREMWERPSPLAGYFTTCGNLNGDGTFAYRVAGLPLTLQRLAMLGADKLRKPENRLYAEGTLHGSTWEARHELFSVKYLLHLPFIFFAIWLGGGLWWVSRRLFGNEGGFFALGLYCFCPAVVQSAVTPNNDVLAMWGLYGLVYAAMGVAHAMQGPRYKWRPRIALLTVALGLTAAAHLLAAHAAREEPNVDRTRQHDDPRRDAEIAQVALHRWIRHRDGARGVRVDAREPHDRAARHARLERHVVRVILESRVIGKDEPRAIATGRANRHPPRYERRVRVHDRRPRRTRERAMRQ